MNILKTVKSILKLVLSRKFWRELGAFVGVGKKKKIDKITGHYSLVTFIESTYRQVAKTSPYGYLRTRAGTRFPELFKNPDILVSINMAKWHTWLACVGDLSVFVGRLLFQSGRLKSPDISALVSGAMDQILQDTGTPDEAGGDYSKAVEKTRQRIHTLDWSKDLDDDTIFSRSPSALFYWAPIADELKNRDEEIVRNSVRFRWIEIRRSSRQLLDFDSLANTFSVSQTAEVNAVVES